MLYPAELRARAKKVFV